MAGTESEVVERLQQAGMSAYEAKCYTALVLAEGPLNGYEVAKRSGVPRSTVYEALGKLTARGAAFKVMNDDGATEYLALPADALVRRLRAAFDETITGVTESLENLSGPPTYHLSHHLEGSDAVLARAADLIAAARGELYVSAWPEEVDALEPVLEQAVSSGVGVAAICFGPTSVAIPNLVEHVYSSSDIVLERVGARLLIVVQDRSAVLIGGAVGDSMWALYSDDPAVILLAVEFIRHDIAFQSLVGAMGVDKVADIYQADPILRALERGKGAPGLDRRLAALLAPK